MSKMYNELATWWPLLSPPEEYVEEAEFFRQILLGVDLSPAPTLLELGCGGGNNALHLKGMFAHVTLTDLSPHMVAMSRTLNPECEHEVGDMRTLRLGRVFEVVFIHDAIDYMTSVEALRQAMETAFIHCQPGGVVLLVPDHVSETFEPYTDHGGTDNHERGLRYLEWSYDPDETDTMCTVDYVYVLQEHQQVIGVEHDQHVCGLFPRDTWLQLLHEVGFQPQIVIDPYEREVFVAIKAKS